MLEENPLDVDDIVVSIFKTLPGNGYAKKKAPMCRCQKIITPVLRQRWNIMVKLGAEDSYELERCWENTHRMYQAEAHVRTMLFREETRWPGYYFRADTPKMDEDNWHVFVNCSYADGDWKFEKKDVVSLVD